MKYFLWINGKQEGPYEAGQIRQMLNEGTISPLSLAIPEDGAGEWSPLNNYSGILAPAKSPPVLPSGQAVVVDATPMGTYEYTVVPFVAVIKLQEGSRDAAEQLELLIRNYAQKGWQYVRLESVETFVHGDNGCFGIGATPPRTTVYSMVVFKR